MAGSAAGFVLKVTPQQLKSKAEQVTKEIGEMSRAFEELTRTVSKTSHYWIGEAGDTHRDLYEKKKDDIDEMLRRFREHPTDLLTMAGVYEQTEIKVTEISMQLPEDVIS